MADKLRILNIHGYRGSRFNSAYQALVNDYDVVSPEIDYDAERPGRILGDLRALVVTQKIDAIVGTSLGGFFALVLCANMDLPTLTINPALVPGMYLPGLGYKRPGGIRGLFNLGCDLECLDRRYISTIVGTEDEVIDSHDYTRLILGNNRFIEVPGGKHSGSTLGLGAIIKERGVELFNDIASKDFV